MVDPATAGAVGCVAAVAAASGGLVVLGFGAAGVTAGSYAAGYMSGVGASGGVAAGGWFATFQSVGVLGLAKSTIASICGAGAAAAASAAGGMP